MLAKRPRKSVQIANFAPRGGSIPQLRLGIPNKTQYPAPHICASPRSRGSDDA